MQFMPNDGRKKLKQKGEQAQQNMQILKQSKEMKSYILFS